MTTVDPEKVIREVLAEFEGKPNTAETRENAYKKLAEHGILDFWLPPAGIVRGSLAEKEVLKVNDAEPQEKTPEEIARDALVADLKEKMATATLIERFVIQGIVDGNIKDRDISDFCRKYISLYDAITRVRAEGYTVSKHGDKHHDKTSKHHKRTKK